MESPRSTPWTRRRLLGRAGQLAAGAAVVPSLAVLAQREPPVRAAGGAIVRTSSARTLAPAVPLIDRVAAICQRLGPAGWRNLLLRASNNELDLGAADLAAALARPLARIDRTVPGFEDFALEGQRGIAPGAPARSLLFHALASPNVFEDGSGNILGAFPTPAELETVENYVFGVEPPSLDEVHGWASGHPLGVVVFALEYRPARETVHGKHADFCFARTGHARMGTTEAIYDPRKRDFLPGKADDPFAFPVQPVRYAPFLAVQRPSDPDTFGPLRATDDDRGRRFWVPLHKLFSGPECLRGLDLDVSLSASHVNEKLRRFHLQLNTAGFNTGWAEPEIDQYPFVIRDEALASLSRDPDLGSGWVMPRPHPLVEPAEHDGGPLTFFYSPELAATPDIIYLSSLQPLERSPFKPLGPGRTQALPENIASPDADIIGYLTTISPDRGRSTPEYLNVRQKVTPDGTDVDLNATGDVKTPLGEGGFWARHFIDHTADGWVAARCPELDAEVPTRVPAYSIVCPPSFYPYASQRALTEWAEQEAPEELRDGIWAIPPRPLSDRRLAANITLPVRFSIDDDTVTAIVSLPMDTPAQQSGEPVTQVRRHLQLPDAAAGLFDPGWEVSQDRTTDNRFFLAGYGLGTPFIEDVKLCATFSTFWPGVAPDSAREFQPNKPIGPRESQVWPTIAPMTDEELGLVPVDGQEVLPWDGVQGPRLIQVDGVDVVDYPAILHTDYLNTVDRFTAALTSKVDQEAYVARVLAMAQVYWALGIRYADFRDRYELAEALDRFQAAKGEWSVLSCRIVAGDDAELGRAQESTGTTLQGDALHRFHLFQWNGQEMPGDDVSRIRVGIAEQAVAYADLQQILMQRGEAWEHHVVPH